MRLNQKVKLQVRVQTNRFDKQIQAGCLNNPGSRQPAEKSSEDVQKHQYFGLNRSIFMQKLPDQRENRVLFCVFISIKPKLPIYFHLNNFTSEKRTKARPSISDLRPWSTASSHSEGGLIKKTEHRVFDDKLIRNEEPANRLEARVEAFGRGY